jgi:hypothetical protein
MKLGILGRQIATCVDWDKIEGLERLELDEIALKNMTVRRALSKKRCHKRESLLIASTWRRAIAIAPMNCGSKYNAP